MNKSKKYHCGLLVVAVIAFFSLTSVNASDNFVKISLPKGVSIELPKDWVVLSEDRRIALDTIADSGLDLACIEHENSDIPFTANYYKDGKIVGIIQTKYHPTFDLTQNDSRQATPQYINEWDTALKENIVKSVKTSGMPILSWEGTKKIAINGITAFITENHRKAKEDPVAFRVRLVCVFAGERTFQLSVSYREEEQSSLKPITDRIISSLKLSGINETTTSNSQVYTKPTDITDSVMSHTDSTNWLITLSTLLVFTLLTTWGIGLTPPLLIRFLIMRRPMGRWWAIGTVVIFFFIYLMISIVVREMTPTISWLVNKTHTGLLLIAVVSYFILRKKLKHQPQSEKKPKKKRGIRGWIWILFGLLCICFIGMIVVFKDIKPSVGVHSDFDWQKVIGSAGLMFIICIILGLIFGVRFLILKFRYNKKQAKEKAIKAKLEAEGYVVSNGIGRCFICEKEVTFEEKENSLFCPECGWERDAAIRNRLENEMVHKKESEKSESVPQLLKEEFMNEKNS